MNIGTPDDEETVTFRARRFDRSPGARIYTLHLRRIGGKAVLHVD